MGPDQTDLGPDGCQRGFSNISADDKTDDICCFWPSKTMNVFINVGASWPRIV